MHQLSESSPGKFDITLRCLAGLFSESMQNINCFSMGCQINHPILAVFLYSNFPGTFSDSRHRFPIRRSESVLDFIQLMTNLMPDKN